MEPVGTSHLLVIDDDADIRETLGILLVEEGYIPHVAASLSEAMDLIDSYTFDLILTDLFGPFTPVSVAEVRPLVEKARPTPVAICSARPLPPTEALTSFAFVLRKPFDLQDLVTSIAATLQSRLDPHTDPRAVLAEHYFAALSAKDWDALLPLCHPDIVYVLPGDSPWSHTITGQAAFRTYTEQTFQQFPDAQFSDLRVYPTPKGMAVRYSSQFTGPDDTHMRLGGAVTFQVVEHRIQQIGVQTNTQRLPHPATQLPRYGETVLADER